MEAVSCLGAGYILIIMCVETAGSATGKLVSM
jgi:hypothetical protein